MVDGAALEVVYEFCYLGDMISVAGGVEECVIARTRSGWKRFRDLLPILTCRGFSLRSKGRVYQEFFRSVMLYGSETSAVKETDLLRLERNYMRMIRWMCCITLKDRKPSSKLREHLGLDSIRNRNRRGRFRHVERCNE